MKVNNCLFILLVVILISGCANKKHVLSQLKNIDGFDMLYGSITREQLFFDFPHWMLEYEKYQPDGHILSQLNANNKDLSAEIFLGTWCSDSQREVPRFFKIIDLVHLIPAENILLWAVDRRKKLETGLTEEKNIRRVATFIIKYQGNEVGRIVERPLQSLENDLLTILETIPN